MKEGWELVVEIENVEVGVPDSIKQMIEKQVDHLDAEQQRTLEAASVAGAEFSTLALVAGLEEDRGSVEARCDELARQRQFIQDCGVQELPNGEVVTRYGFIHALYQNVLYERVSASRRVQLHRRIGERGEELYGERAREIAAELAMHFERGRDYKRAAKYLQQAADNAIRRFAYQEAVALARRGLELLGKLPDTPERASKNSVCNSRLGMPLIATEGYAAPDVGNVYMRARELCQQIGETPDVSEVLWGLWTFHTLRAELDKAREIAEEFLRLSERLPYPGLAMRGHWAMEITFFTSESSLGLEHFEKALALYDPVRHRDDAFLYAQNPGVAMRLPCRLGTLVSRSTRSGFESDPRSPDPGARVIRTSRFRPRTFLCGDSSSTSQGRTMAQEYAEAAIAVSHRAWTGDVPGDGYDDVQAGRCSSRDERTRRLNKCARGLLLFRQPELNASALTF